MISAHANGDTAAVMDIFTADAIPLMLLLIHVDADDYAAACFSCLMLLDTRTPPLTRCWRYATRASPLRTYICHDYLMAQQRRFRAFLHC